MRLNVYQMYPIDLGWGNLQTLSDFIANPVVYSPHEGAELSRVFEQVLKMCLEKGWGGDDSESVRVMWLPNEVQFMPAFAWKEGDNGTTYIASPVEMDWLDRHTMDSFITGNL